MPIGTYDPDYENYGNKRPAWQTPKTDLQRRALAACGRKYFKDRHLERRAFEMEEDKARGETEEKYLHRMWIVHNIELCEEVNHPPVIERSFPILMRMIQNDSRMVDWKAANREKALAERKEVAITDSFKQLRKL